MAKTTGTILATDNRQRATDNIERFRSKLASIFPSLFKKVDKKKQVAGFSGIDLLGIEELERQIENVKKGN